MTIDLTTKTSTSAEPSGGAFSGFRLTKDHLSDGSDDDQSAHSERSLSPSRNSNLGTRSKIRRTHKQERRQVGALTDDLGTLLGAAFQAPNESVIITGNADHVAAGPEMEIENLSGEKKMSKRTRQNLVKAERRRLAREHQQNQSQKLGISEAAQKPSQLPLDKQHLSKKARKVWLNCVDNAKKKIGQTNRLLKKMRWK
ncbi:hypothetical protein GQ44DRAFT_726185 [Phaeosphaeriaceae sp. PMI808]|nr:hypothetical protein GQ44DRAFT_726185 [Phaeosphaeriaceae sp. PMI808]